jgi:TP901 family phage tail tape measure protein
MAGKFSLEAIFRATDKLSAPIARIRGNLDKFGQSASRSLASLDRSLGVVHGGIKRVAAATVAVGAVGGVAAFSIIKAGAEFEQAITAVGAVSLQTRDQIKVLESEAMRLGATTKYTATEAANAMELMARAGFSNAEILKGVGPVLDAAAASGLEIAEVANHVSNALKGMGLDTSETARVADVLALASSRTNSSIGSLGESLSNVASTARQFKIPLEDTIAGVALLQDVGLDASVAGSALNVMLTQMAAPTEAIAAKMKQFGVTFKDAQGNMLPFQDVLANISKAAAKSGGNMDQVAFMAELVGLRGQKAAANLSDLFNSGRVQSLTKELRNAEGSAKKMAAIRMDNTLGDWELFASAVDGVKLALFETQGGPLRGLIQSMTKWVELNQGLIVSEFRGWLMWIRDRLPEIVTWLGRIGKALVAFYALSAAVKVARLAIFAYQVAQKLAVVAEYAWKGAVLLSRLAVLAYHAATKLAIVGTWALRAATLAARLAVMAGTAATWLYHAALKAGVVATTRYTVAQVASKVAQVASRAATALATAAQTAYATVVGLTSGALSRCTVAEVAAKVAQVASRAATLVATAAQTAYAAVVGTSSGALAAFRVAALASAPAIAAQVTAMAPLLLTLGAATVAVMALVAAWDQYNKLDKALEGSGGVSGTVGKMWEMGTFDPFEAHDAALNEKALADRRRRDQPQVVSPQARVARETAEVAAAQGASVDGTIVVEAKPGTKAQVKGKTRNLKLDVQPSGAF